jgi:hypothetical protein
MHLGLRVAPKKRVTAAYDFPKAGGDAAVSDSHLRQVDRPNSTMQKGDSPSH